jgi:hypothetical protein
MNAGRRHSAMPCLRKWKKSFEVMKPGFRPDNSLNEYRSLHFRHLTFLPRFSFS